MSDQKPLYIIMYAETSQELATKVSRCIVEGYEPHGSAYAVWIGSFGQVQGAHYQPMVLGAPNTGNRGPG